jgi:hypothetical protein
MLGWLIGTEDMTKRNGLHMTRTLLLLSGILVFLCVQYVPASAAELGLTSPRTAVRTYVKHERRYVGCPAYYCAPLYGAYGPYGGQAYWSAYTGWYR